MSKYSLRSLQSLKDELINITYVLKMLSSGSKECCKKLKLECANFLGQTFDRLGLIRDPLIVSKFHNDLKGQENKMDTIVKGREPFYRGNTVPITSFSEVRYVLKMLSFASKELKLECANVLGQTS